MKAIWLPDFTNPTLGNLTFPIENFHHLIRVQRAQVNEKILIIGLCNSRSIYTICEITKKNFTLYFNEALEITEKKHKISWAIGYVKKPAMEDIIQRGVELGIERIFFIPSEFAQKLIIPQDRLRNLIESSIIQSKALGVPDISFLDSMDDLKTEIHTNNYNQIIISHFTENGTLPPLNNSLLCIGPQGGWSENDLFFFNQLNNQNQNLSFLQLPTPILRTEHAAVAMTGFILGRI